MSRNTTIDGHEFDFSLRWDIFYMIDAFERHELDSITGQEKVTINIFDYIFYHFELLNYIKQTIKQLNN